jgi:ATP-dependent Clp protease ATP-binding subunit ClpX
VTYAPPTCVPSVAQLVKALDVKVSGLPEQKLRMATLIARHCQAALHDRPYSPPNALVIGPTGGGKSFMVRELCEVSGVPYIEVNATQFSEVGYIGRDLSSMFMDFVTKYGMRGRELMPIVQRWGVVILDEIDKWRYLPNPKERQPGRALQAELLKILEGDLVISKRRDGEQGVPVNTTHILNVGVGAFEGLEDQIERKRRIDMPNQYMQAEPMDIMDYGFMIELVGRFPAIIPLPQLDPTAMARILDEHVLPQYVQEVADAGCTLECNHPAMVEIASQAIRLGIGARALGSLMDAMLWRALGTAQPGDHIVLDVQAVLGRQARVECQRAA